MITASTSELRPITDNDIRRSLIPLANSEIHKEWMICGVFINSTASAAAHRKLQEAVPESAQYEVYSDSVITRKSI